jgi:fucose 4-O-acetylase-like acetyltransferase
MLRLYYFDNIKILLIVIIIFIHSGAAYVPVAAGWPVNFPEPVPFVNLFVVDTFLR